MDRKRMLARAWVLLGLFALWTVLVCTVDLRSAGESGTLVGFGSLNSGFHRMTGVHWWLYTLTDWLGLVPVAVCCVFGLLGLCQLIARKSLWRVDRDLLLLGIYYGIVVLCYLVFETVPVNMRPVRIQGRAEASYPSSTTLLVLSVMPTLVFQARRRLEKGWFRAAVCVGSRVFAAGMVLGRLLSGVHWLTDIIGAMLLSAGLVSAYGAAALPEQKEKEDSRNGTG